MHIMISYSHINYMYYQTYVIITVCVELGKIPRAQGIFEPGTKCLPLCSLSLTWGFPRTGRELTVRLSSVSQS